MGYSSSYRPCHSVWSDADAESLKKAVLSVDPDATFEDGNVGYSYPYGQNDLLCMMADYISLPDGCSDIVETVREILRVKGINIRDISARMRDYDGDGYLDGISENVKGILEECLAGYILEEHPEWKSVFGYLDFSKVQSSEYAHDKTLHAARRIIIGEIGE